MSKTGSESEREENGVQIKPEGKQREIEAEQKEDLNERNGKRDRNGTDKQERTKQVKTETKVEGKKAEFRRNKTDM